MRMWHKNLISVLPRQQLIAQWRELCAIVSNIERDGTPNHLLVNKVLLYPSLHLVIYTNAVLKELNRRGYNVSENSYTTLCQKLQNSADKFDEKSQKYIASGLSDIYADWHNNRYFTQCYYNLQEKWDCGGITTEEWSKIVCKKGELKIELNTL